MKEIHKPNIFLIYGKWYQHVVRYCCRLHKRQLVDLGGLAGGREESETRREDF